jgi:hypothetical protein
VWIGKTSTSFTDKTDLNRLDLSGAEHGFLAPFQRTLIRLAGPVEESAHLRRHVEDVRAGHFVIMVLAKAPDRRELVAGILNDHGAEFIGFYTTSQTASRNRRENERSLLARVRAVVMALREGGEIVAAAGTAHEDGRILEQIRDNWWRRRESNQKNGDFLTN